MERKTAVKPCRIYKLSVVAVRLCPVPALWREYSALPAGYIEDLFEADRFQHP
jgi:hypothetical protein